MFETAKIYIYFKLTILFPFFIHFSIQKTSYFILITSIFIHQPSKS